MSQNYPHYDGDVTVIGPECFTNGASTVICYKGQNYYLGSAGPYTLRYENSGDQA